jgi:hypothetical protein
MEEYLNKGIKDVIEEFPAVSDVLNRYDIGCGPCSVGSCLLKDIVEIHDLSAEDEAGLMAEIAGIIFPGQEIDVPRTERKSQPAGGAAGSGRGAEETAPEARLAWVPCRAPALLACGRLHFAGETP